MQWTHAGPAARAVFRRRSSTPVRRWGYGCCGVRVSLLPQLADLPQVARHIAPFSGLVWRYRDALDGRKGTAAAALLTELNVLEQGRLLRASQIARGRERPPLAQGWILSLADGRLQELDSGYATPAADVEPAQAVTAAARG